MSRRYRAIAAQLTGHQPIVLFVLRAVVGWLFILHAVQKIHLGRAGFENFVLKPAHMPMAGLLAWVIPALELGGGILLVLGLFTRIVAVLLAAEMVGTGFGVKLSTFHSGILGPHGSGGAEVDLLYLVTFLLLIFTGPGWAALDAWLDGRRLGER